jgi:hypothetical protein
MRSWEWRKMIKLGPMKIGIRKLRFHQFDLRWGDTLVDGWDSFVGWVHVQRFITRWGLRVLQPSEAEAAAWGEIPDLAGDDFHTVVIDEIE